MGEDSLSGMKADYLKRKADDEARKQNYRDAITHYTEALDLVKESERGARGQRGDTHLILSNRSMALSRCGRYASALEDADECIERRPRWPKAHWRRAQALKGLKRKIEALDALKTSHDLVGVATSAHGGDKEREEVVKEIRRIVMSLRREEVAEWIVGKLDGLQDDGVLREPREEDVSLEEKVEACFRCIFSRDRDPQSAQNGSHFHGKVFEWLLHANLDAREAYGLRSAIYAKAKCLKQAQADAKMAVACTHKHYNDESESGESSASAFVMNKYKDLARAYHQLGLAYTCEGKDHADADFVQGVKAFSQACEYDGKDEACQSKLKETSELLSPHEMQQVRDLLQEANAGDYQQNHLLQNLGKADRMYQLEVAVTFSNGTRQGLTAAARSELRRTLAKICRCESELEVQISSIRFSHDLGLTVGLEAHLKCSGSGERLERVRDFVAKVSAEEQSRAEEGESVIFERMEGSEVARLLGRKIGRTTADLRDITETIRQQCSVDTFEFAHLVNENSGQAGEEDAFSMPSRPKTDIELPYKMYRLVYSDGSHCERIDKHGFSMSRVYYSKSDLPDEVYAELCDGSLRWRQSSDEVKVVLLRVPRDLKASRDLRVEIHSDSVRCASARSGEVYFEGALCRGVIPEQSLWEYDRDTGEVTFHLKKMNLELLSRSHQHAEMWWPKLCAHHCEIQWDDYEKDYSDLPDPIMKQHANNEEQSKLLNNLEYKERMKREALQEGDELRKRLRQERLHEMKSGGERVSWAQLQRRR